MGPTEGLKHRHLIWALLKDLNISFNVNDVMKIAEEKSDV
jgi:hypothetical protein